MIRHPPLSTLTDTLFPYTPLFRPTRERVLGAADGHIAHLGRRRSQIVLVPAGLHADERSVERLGRRRRANTRRQRKRSEEHTSELQSLMRISYAVFCLKKKNTKTNNGY